MKLRTDSLLAQFRFVSPECTVFESGSRHRIEELSWIVPIEPFPFKTSPLSLRAKAAAVPVAKYDSYRELESASWDFELDWQVVQAV
jgi:hypothetical protein